MNKKSPKSTIFIFLILPMVCAANLKVFECRSVLAKANDVQPSSYSQLRLKEGELIGAVSFFIYSKEEEVKLHHDKLGQIDLIIKKNITNFNFDDYDNVTIDQEDGAKENSLDEHAVGVSFPKKELIFQGDGFVILLRN